MSPTTTPTLTTTTTSAPPSTTTTTISVDTGTSTCTTPPPSPSPSPLQSSRGASNSRSPTPPPPQQKRGRDGCRPRVVVQPIVPPLSFQLVATGVYRSGYPLEINFPMLERLKLKTVIYLADQPYSEDLRSFLTRHKIKLHHFPVPAVREPFVSNDPVSLTGALHIIADRRNHPVLVHSNKGKHRAGVLVGVMRVRLQRWSLAAAQDEYGRFAGGKGEADLEFIEMFEPQLSLDNEWKPEWVRI